MSSLLAAWERTSDNILGGDGHLIGRGQVNAAAAVGIK
jgi:hypothetical protein